MKYSEQRAAKTRITIGISTVRRPQGPSYLAQTVDCLLAALPADERELVQIVIVNATSPADAHTDVAARHGPEVSVRLSANYRARPRGRQPEPRESPEYLAWVRKLSLDFAATLKICRETSSDYILRLEDDVIAADRFVSKLLNWIDGRGRKGHDWAFLSLSPWISRRFGSFEPIMPTLPRFCSATIKG